MLFRALLALFVLGAFIPAAAAQDRADRWYFAFNKDTGSLVAYNLDGLTNVLIKDGVTGMNAIGTRISDTEALLLLRVNEQFGLYHATPFQVTRLVGEDGILQVPLAVTNGAAVMVNQYDRQPVYASLFKEGRLTPLPQRVVGLTTLTRFSQDGAFVRALGTDENGSFVLWNFDTTSGEASTVVTFGADMPQVRSDVYGERWMQRQPLADGQVSYRILHLDGTTEELGTFDESQVPGSVYLLGDDLVAYPAVCEASCTAEVRSSPPRSFQVDSATFRSLPVAASGTDSVLLLNRDDAFYMAHGNAAPQFVGAFTRDRFHVFSASFQAVSPDRRWLMVVDDQQKPTRHDLVDLTTLEVVASYDFSKPPAYLKQVLYGDGLIAFKLNNNAYDFVLYDADSAPTIIHQPRGTNIRVYFELLPDQQALYRAANPYSGIVRHDLKTGTETPLLEGAWEYITLLTLR